MDAQRMPQAGDTVSQVKITNKNDFTIKDRYDNVEFLFKPDVPVRVPLPVAAHCFGYRPWVVDDAEAIRQGYDSAADANMEAMLKYCAKRHGWNTVKHQQSGDDQKFFGNIDIVAVTLHLVEEEELARASKLKA